MTTTHNLPTSSMNTRNNARWPCVFTGHLAPHSAVGAAPLVEFSRIPLHVRCNAAGWISGFSSGGAPHWYPPHNFWLQVRADEQSHLAWSLWWRLVTWQSRTSQCYRHLVSCPPQYVAHGRHRAQVEYYRVSSLAAPVHCYWAIYPGVSQRLGQIGTNP